MTNPFESKVWGNRSQQTIGHVKIIFSQNNDQQTKIIKHKKRKSTNYPLNNDFYETDNKEKQARIGRWVLHAIAIQESNQFNHINNSSNEWYSDSNQTFHKKKHGFHFNKSTKIEPIETLNQSTNQLILNSTIEKEQSEILSNFSSATSVDDLTSFERSEDFTKRNDSKSCLKKPMIIIITIISAIIIIGILIAVFTTIFIPKNVSTNSSSEKNVKSSIFTLNNWKNSIEIFNITDHLCQGKTPYNYFSFYQMATSSTFTIRFILQHDTHFGHWYFDDISALQNNQIQLIKNGGFESNLTGWIVRNSSNLTIDTFVDKTTNFAHSGLAYLKSTSKIQSVYIEQTFNVSQNEYFNISFWWGYDGGFQSGLLCKAIVQLIPSL